MRDIIIIGAGGLGREVLSMINRINKEIPTWNVKGFIDDGIEVGSSVAGLKILGGVDYFVNYKNEIDITIAIGNVTVIKKIVASLNGKNISFPNIIDPTAYVDPSAKIGIGNIITYLSFLSCDVIIRDFNIINTKSVVAHDSKLGSYNVLNPNVQICGNVQVGDDNFWGVNSTIVQGQSVGNRCTIGAFSLMLRSADDDSFFFGVPARKLDMKKD